MDELDLNALAEAPAADEDAPLRAILEAIVYIADEPLSAQQIAAALAQPLDRVQRLLDELVREYSRPEHGLTVREIAGGYKMATKPEHHEAVRAFVETERLRGRRLEGPAVFHCAHRAYGVGMFDVADVIAADRMVAESADARPAEVLVGTVSHCHGALAVLALGEPTAAAVRAGAASSS